EIQRPAPCGTGRSMPSGHATVAFAFLASAGPFLIRIQRRRLAVGLAILAIGVAGARVVLGVHYPSDVLVGAVVGGLVGWMIQRGFTTIARSFE
ncbi:MAG: phosphatase PAP2 family protein, partial [Myxococcota bacterium]